MEILITLFIVASIAGLAWRFRNFLSPKKENPKLSDPDFDPLKELLNPQSADSQPVDIKQAISWMYQIAGSMENWESCGNGDWKHKFGIKFDPSCGLNFAFLNQERILFMSVEEFSEFCEIFRKTLDQRRGFEKMEAVKKQIEELSKTIQTK